MKPLRSAKQVTFLYFSIVALSIIAIHASVFELTTEDLEHFYAQNKLGKVKAYTNELFSGRDISQIDKTEFQTQGKTSFDKNAEIYFDFDLLPAGFPDPADLEYDLGLEIVTDNWTQAYFIMKIRLESQGIGRDALLVLDNSLYELSEKQLISSHTKQIAISFMLLLVSLFIVLKISERLSSPISSFANQLENRSADDLSLIELPEGSLTTELEKMVSTFNAYQSRIQSLIDRERAFNAYASHELRSPLMVISGALTLLYESDDPDFLLKQRQRLEKATLDMSEFIETLLSLSKPVNENELVSRRLSFAELNLIAHNHQHLLEDKPVDWQVKVSGKPEIKMPEAALHILLGNLVKNSFAFTQSGKVVIKANEHCIEVSDTGSGLNSKAQTPGFGLGLLLVRDLCRRYQYEFELSENDVDGCSAKVLLKAENR